MAIDLNEVATRTARQRPMRYSRLIDDLRRDGFVCGSLVEWGAGPISSCPADWAAFADSWNRLDLDPWMGDGGRYRHRRFAAFSLVDGSVKRKPHQPHFQRRQHNHLNGGTARWFSPVEREVATNSMTVALLRIGEELAGALVGWTEHAWHVEMHQFRIVADGTEPGRPTPEGLHRDGVSAVLMVLVGRHNVTGGITTLVEKGRFTAEVILSQPLQGIFLDDRHLHHCVSPIIAAKADRPAWRDALVLTFRPANGYFSSAPKETCHG